MFSVKARFILCFIILSGQVFSQSGSSYVPTLVPPSPNAASLMKFVDVPVSPYTGTADVSVPVYTIAAKGLSIPISLTYHTGGVKVKEEASWVGLGWALNAGGTISRTILGDDDFKNSYFSDMNLPQYEGDMASHTLAVDITAGYTPYVYDFRCNYNVNLTTGVVDFTNALPSATLSDLQPDVYSYNFLGHTGKFMIKKDKQVVLQNQENLKFDLFFTANRVDSIKVKDDAGNQFFFSVKEYTEPVTATNSSISSWQISRAITALQDTITFRYVDIGNWTTVMSEVYLQYNVNYGNEGIQSTNPAANTYSNVSLSEIDFSGGKVVFSSSNDRTDLLNGRRLNSIVLYSQVNNIYSQLWQEQFYYSYFQPAQTINDNYEYERLKLDSAKRTSATVSEPSYKFEYSSSNIYGTVGKHSNSVDHWGFFNGKGNSNLLPSTSITYSEDGVPKYFQYSGANREADSDYMQLFALTKITYPTGGSSVLAFSSNDYSKDHPQEVPTEWPQVAIVNQQNAQHIYQKNTTTGTIDLTHIYPIIPNGVSGTNLTLNLAFRYSSNNTTGYKIPSGQIYFTFNGVTTDVSNGNLVCSGPVCSVSLSYSMHSPQVLSWTAYIAPNVGTDFQDIDPTFTYQETQEVVNQQAGIYKYTAGGLRIKTITEYTADNQVAKKRLYSYTYTKAGTSELHSYGRLMSSPSYIFQHLVPVSDNNTPATYHLRPQVSLYGTSNTSLTSVIQGNIAGYDTVREYQVNPADNSDNGIMVYSYFNLEDTVLTYNGMRLPGLPNLGNNLNGSLLDKTVYARNGTQYTILSSQHNYFSLANRHIYYSPKTDRGFCQYIPCSSGYNPNSGCPNNTTVSEAFAWFYPSVKSEKILLDSTKHILYSQGDPTKYSTTTTINSYDNPVHYQITRSKMTDSKGNVNLTGIKYPQDYIPSGHTVTGNTILDSLIRRNMVGVAIEKRDTLFYSSSPSTGYVTGAQLNLYRILSGNNNTIVADKIYKLDVQSPVTDFTPFAINGNTTSMDTRYRQMVSFDSYDPSNNLQQFTGIDQLPVCIIWDYQNTYPIAQVKNATNSQIAYTSFEADGAGGWTINNGSVNTTAGGMTGSKSFTLGGNSSITKAGLVSGNYIVTYWSKSNYPTVNGAIGTVIMTKSGWTLYRHNLYGITSVTITGTNVIDELRLYPADGQMTTYTYTPLLGMTSQCDAVNHVIYYQYDALGRLNVVRDIENYILKQYCYNYAGQTAPCNVPLCATSSSSYVNHGGLTYTVTMVNSNTAAIFSFTISAGRYTGNGLYYPFTGTQTGIPSGYYNITIAPTSGSGSFSSYSVAGGLYQTGNIFSAYNIQVVCPTSLSINITQN